MMESQKLMFNLSRHFFSRRYREASVVPSGLIPYLNMTGWAVPRGRVLHLWKQCGSYGGGFDGGGNRAAELGTHTNTQKKINSTQRGRASSWERLNTRIILYKYQQKKKCSWTICTGHWDLE